MQRTAEQTHILDLATGTPDNLMIRALAGTGKSTMLEMVEQALPDAPLLYLCFGRLDLDKATKRVKSTTTARNFNGLGHRIWAQYIGKSFKPDTGKVGDIYKGFINGAKDSYKKELWNNFGSVLEAVGKAKALGFIPPQHVMSSKSIATWDSVADSLDEVLSPLGIEMVQKALTESIRLAYAGVCDFNDQVYMPALFGGIFPRFPVVLGDECQDWNNVNWRMFDKLASGSRSMLVGDPFQSIYVFRGATPDGMYRAAKRHRMVGTSLSVSFRCPRRVVEHVHWHVPEFRWHKPGGSVNVLENLSADTVAGDATFICRNNAPLYRLAIKFLSSGYSVNVSGSDLGPRLLNTMKKLGDGNLPQSTVLSRIDAWEDARDAKGSKTAKDTAECMRVFARHGSNLDQAMAYAKHLFAQEGTLTFTTGHKAKGREWDVVFIVDDHLLGEDEQERNLAYVMATRSADQLYYVKSADVRFS